MPTFAGIPQMPKSQSEVVIHWGSLLRTLFGDGSYDFDTDPEYKRVHKWTHEQQIAYLEYVMRGGETGQSLIWNCYDWDHPVQYGKPRLELVDGKQRLNAVVMFLYNQILHGQHQVSRYLQVSVQGL